VARSLNNLAAIYQAQERYTHAEPLYRRSLAIVEKALGPNDPAVATGLNNLAEVLRAQRRDGETEPLLRRALAIFEKAVESNPSAVATTLNNLALLYQAQGRYAEAELLYKRSLTILEEELLPDHPDVSAAAPARFMGIRPRRGLASLHQLTRVLGNLEVFYRETDRFKEAENLRTRVARIREIGREAALPPAIEIATGTVTINGVTVTPTLSKELFFKALGQPTRFTPGEPGTFRFDGHHYPGLGLRFFSVPDKQDVDSFEIALSGRAESDSPFDGTLNVFGKRIPLDTTAKSLAQTVPELGLGLDTDFLSPATASNLGKYAADIGVWRFGVRADAETGAIKSVSVSFTGSVVCRNDRQTDCFDRTTGKWHRSSP
jgi:tetratricopeptide (TPR) repeat protein